MGFEERWEEAEAHYTAALALRPDCPDLSQEGCFARAKRLVLSGQPAAAAAEFESAENITSAMRRLGPSVGHAEAGRPIDLCPPNRTDVLDCPLGLRGTPSLGVRRPRAPEHAAPFSEPATGRPPRAASAGTVSAPQAGAAAAPRRPGPSGRG